MSNIQKGDTRRKKESRLGGYEIARKKNEERRVNIIYKCAKSVSA